MIGSVPAIIHREEDTEPEVNAQEGHEDQTPNLASNLTPEEEQEHTDGAKKAVEDGVGYKAG